MPDFLLPDLGEGLEEAEVVTWHVQVGDDVSVDQIVVEVETAKAAVEVPAPFAGTVSALHAEPGTTVKVGSPLITVTAAAGFRELGAVTPESRATTADGEGSGNVLIGYGTSTATATGVRRRANRRRRTDRIAQPGPVLASSSVVPVISPLVRRIAHDAGLDLTTIHGSGPSGVIRRFDVEHAMHAPKPAVPAAVPAETGWDAGETRIPLRGLRRTVADKLTRSRREIPEATVWVDVDATELLIARRQLSTDDQPVSLLALLARFTILALRRYPELNARVEGEQIVIPGHVHLGFAAQTERGLVVPVVRDADLLSTRDLSVALTSRTAAARTGGLSPSELTGGTLTVNNYGVFGIDGSAAIINHPEVAIIGMGRIIDRPWVIDGQLAVRKVSQLTLAFDHRVCDGGTAGGFLRAIADYIEQPITALGEL